MTILIQKYFLLLPVLFFFFVSSSYGQEGDCPKTTNKKAVFYFQEASELFKSRKYEEARKLVSKAIEEDPEFADAYLLQGSIALKKKNDTEFEQSYKKVIDLCPDLEPDVYYQLGLLYFFLKKWPEAELNLNKFLEYDRINEGHALIAERNLIKAKLFSNPVPFFPKPLKNITTSDPEYLPYISPDNELAFFTRRYEMKDKNMLTPQSVEKFMIAKLQGDGTFDQGRPMEDPFNRGSSNNEGGAAITIDNKHLYFTVNTKGNFDICTSDFVDGKWTEIKNLGPNINDPLQWDSQPSISSDGNTLYFASVKDSLSGIDIYKSEKNAEGEWKKAVRLSSKINTNGNDKSPFIHSDSRTLYFSSDSLPGLGGYDIYKCKMDTNGNWGNPVNLGFPINSDADEVGFFVSTDGKTGYYASNKLIPGGSGFDIFSFELYPEARPERVYFQKGDLSQSGNNEPVAATIEVKDAITDKLTKIDVDSVSGEYAFIVNFENDLIISVKKEGYAFESKYVSTKDSSNDIPRKVNMELKKLVIGNQYTLNDILFTSNNFEINDTIKTVLNEFAVYLKENPHLNVILHGHTDDIGSSSDNMILSENRAKAVADYLLSKEISKSRVDHKGFGESKPIADNSTEEGRAKNRRTVFVVLTK